MTLIRLKPKPLSLQRHRWLAAVRGVFGLECGGFAVVFDGDVIPAVVGAERGLAFRVGDEIGGGPPLRFDEVAPDLHRRALGPVGFEHGGGGFPVAGLPEAPDDEAGHLRMTEGHREHVAQMIGVQLVVERLQIVFGDGEMFHQSAEVLPVVPLVRDVRDGVVAEVALEAAAVRRDAFFNHVLDVLLKARGAIGIEGVLIHKEQLVRHRVHLAIDLGVEVLADDVVERIGLHKRHRMVQRVPFIDIRSTEWQHKAEVAVIAVEQADDTALVERGACPRLDITPHEVMPPRTHLAILRPLQHPLHRSTGATAARIFTRFRGIASGVDVAHAQAVLRHDAAEKLVHRVAIANLIPSGQVRAETGDQQRVHRRAKAKQMPLHRHFHLCTYDGLARCIDDADREPALTQFRDAFLGFLAPRRIQFTTAIGHLHARCFEDIEPGGERVDLKIRHLDALLRFARVQLRQARARRHRMRGCEAEEARVPFLADHPPLPQWRVFVVPRVLHRERDAPLAVLLVGGNRPRLDHRETNRPLRQRPFKATAHRQIVALRQLPRRIEPPALHRLRDGSFFRLRLCRHQRHIRQQGLRLRRQNGFFRVKRGE